MANNEQINEQSNTDSFSEEKENKEKLIKKEQASKPIITTRFVDALEEVTSSYVLGYN